MLGGDRPVAIIAEGAEGGGVVAGGVGGGGGSDASLPALLGDNSDGGAVCGAAPCYGWGLVTGDIVAVAFATVCGS